MTSLALRTGARIPSVGLGVWQTPRGESTRAAVAAALDAVLPKSTHAARIRENAALFDFEIALADLAMLDGLEAGLVTGWDPASVR